MVALALEEAVDGGKSARFLGIIGHCRGGIYKIYRVESTGRCFPESTIHIPTYKIVYLPIRVDIGDKGNTAYIYIYKTLHRKNSRCAAVFLLTVLLMLKEHGDQHCQWRSFLARERIRGCRRIPYIFLYLL